MIRPFSWFHCTYDVLDLEKSDFLIGHNIFQIFLKFPFFPKREKRNGPITFFSRFWTGSPARPGIWTSKSESECFFIGLVQKSKGKHGKVCRKCQISNQPSTPPCKFLEWLIARLIPTYIPVSENICGYNYREYEPFYMLLSHKFSYDMNVRANF